MRGTQRLSSIWSDIRGNTLLIAAASMPLVIGGTGLAADTIQWALWKREAQRQVDSAAMAGAFALAQKKDVNASVVADLARDVDDARTSSPTIENAPLSGPFKDDSRAVRVSLFVQRSLPFSGIFLTAAPKIPASATARIVQDGEFCWIALESTSQTGITIQGNSTVDLDCGMVTNSTSANAITAGGSSSVTATAAGAVGNIPASGNYVQPIEFLPFLPPQPDPFANLPDPVFSNCINQPAKSSTLAPGCYKGGLDIKGNVTLSPGVYYIDGGTVSVNAQAKLSGTGVTIVLTSSTAATKPSSVATISINGGATVNLTASTSGPYSGVLIYQDRRASDSNQVNKINGNSDSVYGSSQYQGAIYIPSQEVQFNGTSDMNTECLQIVARRLTVSGNSKFSNRCPSNGPHAFTGTRVKLVA